MKNILGDKLNLDGDYCEIFSMLYQVFERDIKRYNLIFNGLRVVFDNRKVDSEYEEGFWHIVTHGKDSRIPDYKRAKRLHWLKPIVENYNHADILYWKERDIHSKGSTDVHYLWYEEGDYIVILKQKPGRFFLATAFYVFGYNKRKFMKKYNRNK